MKRFVSLITAIALLLAVACACAPPARAQAAAELLDLGEKYLLEMNYAQAAVKFLRVIEIEPKNPRGYLGAAEAFVGLGDPARAIEILKMGLDELPRDAEIKAMLDALEEAADAPAPDQVAALAAGAAPEPVAPEPVATAPHAPEQAPISEPTAAPGQAPEPTLPPASERPPEPASEPIPEPTAAPAPTPAPTPAFEQPPVGIAVGETAPNFTLSLRGDGSVTLWDLRGTVVLLNACTTWCPPCQREFPEIQAVHDAYGGRAKVLGIDINESVAEVDAYFDQFGYTYALAYDPYGEFDSVYHVDFIPQTWIIDANGVIAGYIAGATDYSAFSAALEKVLAAPSAPAALSPAPATAPGAAPAAAPAQPASAGGVDAGGFILPFSSDRPLAEADLSGLTADELRLARNEIYARHGRQFSDKALQARFDAMPWYAAMQKLPAGTEPELSKLEIANIDLIKAVEQKLEQAQ